MVDRPSVHRFDCFGHSPSAHAVPTYHHANGYRRQRLYGPGSPAPAWRHVPAVSVRVAAGGHSEPQTAPTAGECWQGVWAGLGRGGGHGRGSSDRPPTALARSAGAGGGGARDSGIKPRQPRAPLGTRSPAHFRYVTQLRSNRDLPCLLKKAVVDSSVCQSNRRWHRRGECSHWLGMKGPSLEAADFSYLPCYLS